MAANPFPSIFDGDGAGERLDGSLGRGVDGLAPDWPFGGDRADVEDDPMPLCQHRTKRGTSADNGPEEIGANDLIDVLVGRRREQRRSNDASVVDERVDAASAALECLERGRNGGGIADVESEEDRS